VGTSRGRLPEQQEQQPLLGSGGDSLHMGNDADSDGEDAAATGCFGGFFGPFNARSSRAPRLNQEAKEREQNWVMGASNAMLHGLSSAIVGLRSSFTRCTLEGVAAPADADDDGTRLELNVELMRCDICASAEGQTEHAYHDVVVECSECNMALCSLHDRLQHSTSHRHRRSRKCALLLCPPAPGEGSEPSLHPPPVCVQQRPPLTLDAEEFVHLDAHRCAAEPGGNCVRPQRRSCSCPRPSFPRRMLTSHTLGYQFPMQFYG